MGDADAELTFTFDERHAVAARPGDTVASALLGAGVLSTSRSAKYRRPRGPFCLEGDCGTCLVRIDGIPNVRACLTPVRAGMQVASQNLLGPDGMDPSGIVDKFLGTMDHHHFVVKPKIANTIMQAVARNLTGLGTLPDAPRKTPATHRHLTPDVLVVGAGSAGAAADARLRQRGVDVLTVDRGPGLHGDVHHETAVFAAYGEERLLAAAHRQPGGDHLWTISPGHVLLCVGSRASMVPLQNNDLPGVVSARGLLRQLERSGREPPAGCVVIGEGEEAADAARRLHAPLVAPSAVNSFEGSGRVEAVRTTDGARPCELVALAGPLAPAHDLVVQAGGQVAFDGVGFAAVRDERGQVTSAAPWRLWAAGDVAGHMGPDAAAADGRRVADAIADTLTGSTGKEASP